MAFNATTYHPGTTPIHALDAWAKIVLVLAYSIALFFVHTWTGLALLAVLLGVVAALAKLDILSAARQLIPVGFLLLITLLANAFTFDVNTASANAGAVSAGFLANFAPVPLVGNFGFSPAGFARGCYYVIRIVLLLTASLILTTTSAPTEITAALESFLRPLGRLGFPVRDAATVISIALRFIPVTVDQFQGVRLAQSSRGAPFDTGKLSDRLKAYQTVFIPLFVSLFRRADSLALAMDARAYGLGVSTKLKETATDRKSIAVVLISCVVLAVIAWLF